jgi:predicted DNA-binding protein
MRKIMSTLSIRMPDSLHSKLKKLSKKDNISLNQFITSAVTEKITALETEQYLSERAKRGSKEKYLRVLNKVSNFSE